MRAWRINNEFPSSSAKNRPCPIVGRSGTEGGFRDSQEVWVAPCLSLRAPLYAIFMQMARVRTQTEDSAAPMYQAVFMLTVLPPLWPGPSSSRDQAHHGHAQTDDEK